MQRCGRALSKRTTGRVSSPETTDTSFTPNPHIHIGTPTCQKAHRRLKGMNANITYTSHLQNLRACVLSSPEGLSIMMISRAGLCPTFRPPRAGLSYSKLPLPLAIISPRPRRSSSTRTLSSRTLAGASSCRRGTLTSPCCSGCTLCTRGAYSGANSYLELMGRTLCILATGSRELGISSK